MFNSDQSPSPLPLYATQIIQQAVTAQFEFRPTVRSVVTQLLLTRLSQLFRQHTFNLAQTYVVLTVDGEGKTLASPRYRLLIDVVLEHVANKKSLYYRYYKPTECYVAVSASVPPASGFTSLEPMSAIEPVLLDVIEIWQASLQQALITFWNQPSSAGPTRLQWLAQVIHDQLLISNSTTPNLSDYQRNVVFQVLRFPYRNERRISSGLDPKTKVFNVSARLVGGEVSRVLIPDILIKNVNGGQSTYCYCTVAGKIEWFSDMNLFTRSWSMQLTSKYHVDEVRCVMYEPGTSFLEAQALCVLERQLDAIEGLSQPLALVELERRVKALTNTAAVFVNVGLEQQSDVALINSRLPSWLKNASQADRFAYRSHLIAVASSHERANGKRFTDDVPDLHTSAVNELRIQMQIDQPQAPGYDPDDILLTFIDPLGPGGEGTIGTLNPYTMTLTQLAIENLSAIRSGRMTIGHAKGQLIQDWWMTPDYIKRLVHKVNIGKTYPQWIRACLLSSPEEIKRRARLYAEELIAHLPLQALECKVRRLYHFTQRGYRVVKALMSFDPEKRFVDKDKIVIRHLAFLSTPGVAAHSVPGMFLIGPQDEKNGCHVLYRPFHDEPLVEYPTWASVFTAIATPGALQETVLAWLPSSTRKIYEAGGFYRLNVASTSVHGDQSFPVPAGAAKLSTVAVDQGSEYNELYMDMVNTLSTLADRQTVSNVEQCWQSIITGGWLLFSSIVPNLPLTGPLRIIAGIGITYLAVHNDIEALRSQNEQDKTSAIIDLIFNCALALLHVRTNNPQPLLTVNEANIFLLPDAVKPSVVRSPVAIVASYYTQEIPVGDNYTHLDFAWFSASQEKLADWQRGWLERNSIKSNLTQVEYIDKGPYKGLQKSDGKLFVRIQEVNYRIQLEAEGVILVNPNNPSDRGPSIIGNEAGIWTYDLRIRLRGGGPTTRLDIKKEQRLKRFGELREKLMRYNERTKVMEEEIAVVEKASEKANKKEGGNTATSTERQSALEKYIEVMERQKPEYENSLAWFLEKQTLLAQDNDLAQLVGFYKYLIRLTSNLFDAYSGLVVVYHDRYPSVFSSEGGPVNMEVLESEAYKKDSPFINSSWDKAAGYSQELKGLVNKLRDIPKFGRAAALDAQKYYVHYDRTGSIHSRSAVMCRAYQLTTFSELVMTTLGSDEWSQLREILFSLHLTALTQYELENEALFSIVERTEVLESIRERYARTEDVLAIFRDEASASINSVAFEQLLSVIRELDVRADEMLKEQSDPETEWLPVQATPARVATYTRKIVRTRKKGILIGSLRKGLGQGEAEVVDVGGLPSTEAQGAVGSAQPTVVFTETAPNQWVEVEPTPVVLPIRPLTVLKAEANKLVDNVNAQIRRVKGYAKRSKFPLELEEILDRYAQKLDALEVEIKRATPNEKPVENPKPGTVQMYLKRLVNGAAYLREQGLAILLSLPPTAAVVESLLERKHVSIAKINQRVAMQGERQDFVQEYEVKNTEGKVLWYAHLHYKELNSPAQDVQAAHFKLAAQRYDSQPAQDAKAKRGRVPIQVYYGIISQKMLTEHFLPLDEQ